MAYTEIAQALALANGVFNLIFLKFVSMLDNKIMWSSQEKTIFPLQHKD